MNHAGIVASKNKKQARLAIEIIEMILTVCGSLELGRNVWHAAQIVESVTINGREVKTVGVRIYRKKDVFAPRNRFEEMMQEVRDMLEPVIIIQPLFVQARVRCINLNLMVGERKFAEPKDSIWTFRFRKDLEQILKLIEECLPELNYRTI